MTEHERVATLEPHHPPAGLRVLDQQPVDLVLRHRVPLRSGLTPYTATGDAPVLATAVLVLLLAAAVPRRRRPGPTRRARRTSSSPGDGAPGSAHGVQPVPLVP